MARNSSDLVKREKFMCNPGANFGELPLEALLIQLREARQKWRRRFPKIPLSESV
jgi:hypothetical protein